jgi:tetratricopeptide (TPR) repeat protein
METGLREMDTSKALLALPIALFMATAVPAQYSGQTVRHHRVAETAEVPPELTQAEDAIDKKDYAAAEPLLQKVVAADPANFQAWFDLGFVENALGKTDDSIAAYRKSVAARPDVFESNLNLGLQLAKTGQPDAEQYLRAATTLKPTANVDEGHARAWLSLAHVIEKTKPDEAIAAYQQAAELQPNDVEPHLSAAQLYEKQGKFADAVLEYRKALDLDPNSPDAMTGLANIDMHGQKWTDAEADLKKLVAVQPDNAAAHAQLARVLAAAGNNDEAAQELRTALKLQPNDAAAQRDLADLYVSAKKYPQAEAQYRELLKASPNDPALHYGLGKALMKQNKYADAQQEFLTAVKLKPDFGPAYGDLAAAAVENKNYQLAIKAADARAKFLPEVPASYFLRASAYDHLRDYKDASEFYHKFLEVANGKYPDQEWQARHRLIAIEPKK